MGGRGAVPGRLTSDWKIAGSIPTLHDHVSKCSWTLKPTLALVEGRCQFLAAEPPSKGECGFGMLWAFEEGRNKLYKSLPLTISVKNCIFLMAESLFCTNIVKLTSSDVKKIRV